VKVVDASSEPFAITSHTVESTFLATSNPTITWRVENTATGSVNCPNVDIDLLSFSPNKSTYATANLLSGTPNDGQEEITTIPNKSAQVARFRVSCSDNIFYDISDADLKIIGTGTFETTDTSVGLSPAGICGDLNVIGEPSGPQSSGGGGGGGSLGIWFFLLISGVLPVGRVVRGYTGS
jgi:hypothetical protein